MTAEMSATDLKALARRAIGYNHGAGGDPEQIFAPDFTVHMGGQPPMGRAAFEEFLGGFAAAFPGYATEIEDQVAQGDLVFNRVTWTGTHTGTFAGVPATGRSFALRGINLFRVRDGRMVEQRAELDMFGLLQQIGAIPA